MTLPTSPTDAALLTHIAAIEASTRADVREKLISAMCGKLCERAVGGTCPAFTCSTQEYLTRCLYADAILAAFPVLSKPAGRWQPIETAPRDGSSFLAISGNWQTVCHWHPHQNCWASNGPVYSRYDPEEQPTHWMPLPTQPTAGEDGR